GECRRQRNCADGDAPEAVEASSSVHCAFPPPAPVIFVKAAHSPDGSYFLATSQSAAPAANRTLPAAPMRYNARGDARGIGPPAARFGEGDIPSEGYTPAIPDSSSRRWRRIAASAALKH